MSYLNEYDGTPIMQLRQYKHLQDQRRPFSSCKPYEEWPHIALHCYNENELELFWINA